MLEFDPFRQIVENSSQDEQFSCPKKDALKTLIHQYSLSVIDLLKRIFQNIEEFSFCADGWSSNNTQKYLGVLISYILNDRFEQRFH